MDAQAYRMEEIMAKVGIVMGSDSDMPVMAKAADILEELDRKSVV